MAETATTAAAETASPMPKGRRMRRRLPTRMPRPAVAVRGLWAQASEEERQRAHEAASAILSWWLGVSPKAEVLERLAVKPLRLWQMSQMALSGMEAGLLKQPRARRGALPPGTPAEESREALKKRVARLERDLRAARELLGLLRTLPSWRKDVPAAADEPGGKEARRGALAGRSRAGGAKGVGKGARRDRADAAELAAAGPREAGAAAAGPGAPGGGDGGLPG